MNSRAGPGDNNAPTQTFVSTTNRTVTVLTAFRANGVYFYLNLGVGQRSFSLALEVRHGEYMVISFGKEDIQ